MIIGSIAQQATVRGLSAPGIVVTKDPYYVNTAMQVDATGKADGTSYVTDDSRLANTIIYAGNAQVTGEKFVFDGSGDYIRFGSRALWAPGWHGMTLELFGVEFNSVSGTQDLITHYLADSGNDSRCFYLSLIDGDLIFYANTNGSTTGHVNILTYAWVPATDGTAYDIAASWDGATASLYIDGVRVAQASYTNGFRAPPDVNTHLILGASQLDAGYTRFFAGKIRAARYTKKVDRTEGVSLWTTRHTLPLPTIWDAADFSDPDWDKVVLLVRGDTSGTKVFDDGPWDFKNTSLSGSVSGSDSIVPFSGANSLSFGGNGDFITYSHDPLFSLLGEDYTIEFQARHTDISGGADSNRTYMAKYAAATAQREWGFWNAVNDSPDRLRFFSPNVSLDVYSAGFGATLNQWYHIATTGAAGDRKTFIDGTQSGTTEKTGQSITGSNQPLYIGSLDSLSNYFEGNLTEIRITRSLNRYSANFTAPTSAFWRQ